MEKYEEIVQRTWSDPDFKQKLVSNPRSILAELGVELGEEISLAVHEDTLDTMHFVLLDKSQVNPSSINTGTIAGKVMKHAYEDEGYKSRLLRSPKDALKELGSIVPRLEIKVFENSEKLIHLILPANPNTTGELNDTDLAMVAGGKSIFNDLVSGGVTVIAGAVLGSGYASYLNKVMGPLMVGWDAFKAAANQVD
ncbi:NHLP leader peptide family RiPP precursor [Deltaproteobacteria bacterium TL4]